VSLEEDLRTVLRERATLSAPGSDLLAGVGSGIRRDRRRRRSLAAGGAAALAAIAVAVPVALSHGADRSTPNPPPATRKADWAWPAWPHVAFPMRPGWVPSGAGDRVVTRMGPNVQLDYTHGSRVLSADVGPLPGDWEVEAGEQHTATVNGRTATVRTADYYDGAEAGDRYVGVRWQLADRRWVQVVSLGRLRENDVLRFARGLTAGSVPADPTRLHVTAVPPGLTLQHQSLAMTCLAPPAIAVQERQPTGLCATLPDEPDEKGSPPENVTVAGNPAEYYPEAAALLVQLPTGKSLDLTWDPSVIPLTRDDAIRYAAGIEVTP
jgi:hypothetical protein